VTYVAVAVQAPLRPGRLFTYTVPPDLALNPGHLVWVPFGPQTLQGIVYAQTDDREAALAGETEPFDLKPVRGLVLPEPLLRPPQLDLARWLAAETFCSLFEAASPMLPPGLPRRVPVRFEPTPDPPPEDRLTADQQRARSLLARRGDLSLRELERAFGERRAEVLAAQMVRRGWWRRVQSLATRQPRPATIARLVLNDRAEGQAALDGLIATISTGASREAAFAERQARALEALLAVEEALPLRELRRGGLTPAAQAALERAGLVSLRTETVSRDPMIGRTFPAEPPPTLTSDQEAALAPILQALRGGQEKSFLLHGVTGSGKTELYLRALRETLTQGKRGIVLVPEIALTPQTVHRFAARFPGRVAVLHSQLTPGQAWDIWWRIRDGAYDVVIGARSAVFAPMPDLGLIVLDEEHETTYKQDEPAPRYHARAVALRRAQQAGAVVIMGSATPSVESYDLAQRGVYRLLRLPERVTGTTPLPPPIELIDLRRELREGNRSIFSRPLGEALEGTLRRGEQAILFLNRRGAASFVQCRDCGTVLTCPSCDLPLTYHPGREDSSSSGSASVISREALLCHWCSRRRSVPSACPLCGGPRIRYLGLGTQRVEEEVRQRFPGIGVLRWDRDTAPSAKAHEAILDRFQSGEAQVLIGTQMIAKGLDLPGVTLVGILCADIGLHLPDFRAGERAFQLLTQVAGRAGRGPGGGRVILQTYAPEHPAIAAAVKGDYEALVAQELAFRRQHGYPPAQRLVRLLYANYDRQRCQEEAQRVAQRLARAREALGLWDISFIGPAPAYVQRLRGRYRWHLLIRGQAPQRLLQAVPLPTDWAIDVDPMHLA